MTRLRIVGAVGLLLAVFLFGLCLTWPQFPENLAGFPLDRKFVAISLNGRPLLGDDPAKPLESRSSRLPTLAVSRLSFSRFRATVYDGCNHWAVDIALPVTRSVLWRDRYATANACSWTLETRQRFADALLKTRRWRTEGGMLILENDTDIFRFILAPD